MFFVHNSVNLYCLPSDTLHIHVDTNSAYELSHVEHRREKGRF